MKSLDTSKRRKQCRIEWDLMSIQAWEALFSGIKRSTLLQSYHYGVAMAKMNNQNLRRGVIVIDGEKVGLVQMLEAGILKNAVHGIIIDRGPLWFDGRGGNEDFIAFIERFSLMFPKRFGRRIRLIPEIENNAAAHEILVSHGYKKSVYDGYQTYWLDLRPDIDVLHKNLHKNWRGALRKSKRNNLDIVFDDQGEHFPWLVQHYAGDKSLRGYSGAAPKTIKLIFDEFFRGQNMMIGTALLDGKPIAAILLLIHGLSATYQIGYTSDAGRSACAHHALLWRALSALKERAVYDFDLGGINMQDAKGVKSFKQGMGGELYEIPGVYS